MAKGDMFLKLEGIDGESADSKKLNYIEIDSFSFGASNTGSFSMATGGGTGKTNVQDMHFTKTIDKSTPNLFGGATGGKHIAKATFTVRKAGGDEQKDYFTITLTPCMVSSYNMSGHNGSGMPQESFSLNFDKIVVEYKTQTDTGGLGAAIPAGWQVSANKATTS